jgi:hypothetical protein
LIIPTLYVIIVGNMDIALKFKAQVEYVPEFNNEDEEMNVVPRMIEFEETGNGEEWSTISGSAARGDRQCSVTQREPMQPFAEQSSRSSGNYYNILQEESESGSEENDEGLYEGEAMSGSSFNPTVSEVGIPKMKDLLRMMKRFSSSWRK